MRKQNIWIWNCVTTDLCAHRYQTPIITKCSRSNWTEPLNTIISQDVLKKMQDVSANIDPCYCCGQLVASSPSPADTFGKNHYLLLIGIGSPCFIEQTKWQIPLFLPSVIHILIFKSVPGLDMFTCCLPYIGLSSFCIFFIFSHALLSSPHAFP